MTPTILRATRDMVNSHGSSSGLRVRRFAPSLSRAIALAMGGLALVVSSSVALAAGLTVGLGPPTSGSLFCDAIDACSTVFTGSLTDPSRPGTYVLQLTFDAPPVGDLTNVTQICFAPASSGPNQGILTFTSPDSAGHTVATGQVLLTPGPLCLPTNVQDLGLPVPFSIPFTVRSGSDGYDGAAGSGMLNGKFLGSAIGGADLTFDTVDSADFIVPPPNTCTDPNGCNGNPGGAATPELDSILLFGTGLSGFVAYALRRRRAGKLIG